MRSWKVCLLQSVSALQLRAGFSKNGMLPPHDYTKHLLEATYFTSESTKLSTLNDDILRSTNPKPKLVLLYSSWCPDCKFFRPTWNKMADAKFEENSLKLSREQQNSDSETGENMDSLGETNVENMDLIRDNVDLWRSFEFISVQDEKFSAKYPFNHTEIPFMYMVDGNTRDNLEGHTRIAAYDALGAYTDRKISEREALQQIIRFFRKATKGNDSESTKLNSKAEEAEDQKISAALESYHVEQTTKAEKVLAILASHPGKEMDVLESDEFKDSPLTFWLKKHLNEDKSVLEQAANFFDKQNRGPSEDSL